MKYQKRGGQLITKLNPGEPVASGGNGGSIEVFGQSNTISRGIPTGCPSEYDLWINSIKKSIRMKRINKIVYFSLFIAFILMAVTVIILAW